MNLATRELVINDKKKNMIYVSGYDIIGSERDEGIRYAWTDNRLRHHVESAAFINRTKLGGEDICAYTTSVSSGCLLRIQGCPCRFCRTGKVLPFGRLLTYKEIAKQNIFMVLSDLHSMDRPSLANKPREFAYMGQGEPGFSYSQVRLAIELTNRVMKDLGQTVYRHIFSTCGIPEAIAAYKNDIISGYYSEKVTLHFSLHTVNMRNQLMPINNLYPCKDVIRQLSSVFDVTKEKICVGILLFWNFKTKNSDFEYSTTLENLLSIIDLLDAKKFRLSFCEYNSSDDIGTTDVYPYDEADKLMEYVINLGFEAKYFSSFGQKEMTACGLLGGKEPDYPISNKCEQLDQFAEELINKHINY